MTESMKERANELLTAIAGDNLSVERMEDMDELRRLIESDENVSRETFKPELDALTERAVNAEAELQRVTDAYRRRWNESFVGTKVNGEFVDKTVTEVSAYTYDRLLKGEDE